MGVADMLIKCVLTDWGKVHFVEENDYVLHGYKAKTICNQKGGIKHFHRNMLMTESHPKICAKCRKIVERRRAQK